MRELSFMEATLEGLSEEMARDPTIFVLGEGIGKRGGNFGTTTGLFDLYGPLRLRDTPICERGFIGLAAGAAVTSARRPACTTATAPSGCATRRSASAASSAWHAGRR